MGVVAVWIAVFIGVVIVVLITLYFRWKHSKSELSYTKWMNDRLQQQFITMTAPLINLYSKNGIDENISFSSFCAQGTQFSIEYPSHWTLNRDLGDYLDSEVSFTPPSTEGSVHEMVITVDDLSYMDYTAKTFLERIITSLSSSNSTFAIRRPSQIVIGNRKGSKFTYTCMRAGRNTTVLIVVFVENKRGYTLTYTCASFLYRQLKEVANRMLNSFTIIDSEEDTKIHQSTFSNPLVNPWKDVQLRYCAIQVPSHWETSITESRLFMRSACSRYEDHFFSITALIVDFKSIPIPSQQAMISVFQSNLAKQPALRLVGEVTLPQGHVCKTVSFQCVGMMGRIPIKTWSFVGVIDEMQKIGFILTFVCSEDVFDQYNSLALYFWKSLVVLSL